MTGGTYACCFSSFHCHIEGCFPLVHVKLLHGICGGHTSTLALFLLIHGYLSAVLRFSEYQLWTVPGLSLYFCVCVEDVIWGIIRFSSVEDSVEDPECSVSCISCISETGLLGEMRTFICVDLTCAPEELLVLGPFWEKITEVWGKVEVTMVAVDRTVEAVVTCSVIWTSTLEDAIIDWDTFVQTSTLKWRHVTHNSAVQESSSLHESWTRMMKHMEHCY